MITKILIVFGTRPEAIKMAPLVKAFLKEPGIFETRVAVTAQHREMLDQVLDFFEIVPDYDLNLMKPNQTLHGLTAAIITEMQPIFEEYHPDHVFVHGDTTTSMATAMAAFYSSAKVHHIEAGLRTWNKQSPFPEEMNRQVTGRIADYHYAPTKRAKENLIKENIPVDSIVQTGNTVIDALHYSIEKIEKDPGNEVQNLDAQLGGKEVILVTGHRRENHGQGFKRICKALKVIAREQPDIFIVYPVHLNPKVQEPVNRILGEVSNILLIDPLPYQDFIWLMNRSKIIITDSGGIQEEAPSLGKPVLVMRETTERPEAVETGTVVMVGTDSKKIYTETINLLTDTEKFDIMSALHNPYGDGQACNRIVDHLTNLTEKANKFTEATV
nr:UDP-N-acetylglucosamine 2-epimerase (non-hydrolyzing) [Membranihabitans maritimus]